MVVEFLVGSEMRCNVYLTFDCEDFINPRSTYMLHYILELLEKYNLRALFFVTSHMAQKLSHFPEILNLLESHEIGYHSCSHSVRPTIFEYTDVENYMNAYHLSITKETAHINPLTGESDGNGGIECLQQLFLNKNIVSFRAPGMCWSPPHLEALVKLGIQFDFSAYLSTRPVSFKGVTFFPHPIIEDSINSRDYVLFFGTLFKRKIVVLNFHPSMFVNSVFWDSIYYNGNPQKLYKVQARKWEDTKAALLKFELLLRRLSSLKRRGALEITNSLEKSKSKLTVTKKLVSRSYQKSIWWAQAVFNYEPKYLHLHFIKYFNLQNEA